MDTDTAFTAADGPPDHLASVVLPHRLRRRVVAALSNRTAPVPLADLLATLTDDDAAESPDKESRALAIELHHVHLPKLAAADVLDYDPATTTVTATRTARLAAVLSDGY